MPFQKGNTLGKNGRPGYEIEYKQITKMRRALDRDLSLLDKLQTKVEKGERISNDEKDLMQLTATRISKYLDKLHASKTDVTSDGKQIVINVASEIAEQNGIKT